MVSAARSSTNTPQVLVAGAGPVGLTLAHELTRRGVRVRLVDAREAPGTTSRAIATHPRTLEIYDQMGIVADMLPRGRRINAFTLFQNGRRLTVLEADYRRMPTRYPFTLTISQVHTEQVLRTALARRGVEVEWGTRLTGFTHDTDNVRVTLSGPAGAVEHLDVPWLAGCDGGHSLVRKRLGLHLAGETSETWMLADAQVSTDLPRHSIYWVRTGGITMMMVPLLQPGRWRLLDTSTPPHDSDPDRVAERFTTMIGAGIAGTFQVSRPDWVSVFTFQQRMVHRMRIGRCLVAGDAAHVHSPASGQGMNTGIQEAYNLAWKLAAVIHGQAREELLDSYGEERVPVGRHLLRSTRTATRLIQLRNPVMERILPVFFALVRTVPALRRTMQHKILGNMSALGVDYRASSLSLTQPHAPATRLRPGDRIARVTAADSDSPAWSALLPELREQRWTLVVFDPTRQQAARLRALQRAHKDWLRVRSVVPGAQPDTASDAPGPLTDDGTLRRAWDAGPEDWLLIRPDGYLCARGSRLTDEAFTALLARLPLTAGRPPAP
ncbi:FAD-dependent oxidoreductase [Streptomyces sp. NPDC006193]|uniref:FAD-dependent oxidoreductase n=1 Tax=Streptomyces sp. NPDC006193 TaxID=3155717 RepID=UPI00339ED819